MVGRYRIPDMLATLRTQKRRGAEMAISSTTDVPLKLNRSPLLRSVIDVRSKAVGARRQVNRN
jgi:hypothetical protein